METMFIMTHFEANQRYSRSLVHSSTYQFIRNPQSSSKLRNRKLKCGLQLTMGATYLRRRRQRQDVRQLTLTILNRTNIYNRDRCEPNFGREVSTEWRQLSSNVWSRCHSKKNLKLLFGDNFRCLSQSNYSLQNQITEQEAARTNFKPPNL